MNTEASKINKLMFIFFNPNEIVILFDKFLSYYTFILKFNTNVLILAI